NCQGFIPNLTFTYNSTTGVVVVTDASTFPAGDAIKRINVLVHDEFGKSVPGTITVAGGNTGSISVTSLNRTRSLRITATVLTQKECVSDGSANNIQSAGQLAYWSEDWKTQLAG
ncbi:MAG TPA: hypothetical protein DCL43_09460, partial [Chitinophagaceae bacterium]|nr:hypothetical protein [Chitinophagaceae bacterium]